MSTCLECNGTGVIITCCDDLCAGGDHCIHGDGEEMCQACDGEGSLRDDIDGDILHDDWDEMDEEFAYPNPCPMITIKTNLTDIIRQAVDQVWGGDERDMLHAWLGRNAGEEQIVTISISDLGD